MPVTECIALSLMKSYRDRFESDLKDALGCLGPKNKLRDACEYALLNGGKRVRPIVAMMVAEGIGKGFDVREATLSLEFFHTASLIADDLPCMDDDELRRGKPSLHTVYGEGVSLLASYALITAAFEKIWDSGKVMKEAGHANADQATVLALKVTADLAGIRGATGGQFYDLYPENHTKQAICDVIGKKTGTLFEVAFCLGWIFGGGDLSRVDDVRTAARHFGMAFQMADDLRDVKQDKIRENEQMNFALAFGFDATKEAFFKEIAGFDQKIQELGLDTQAFRQMITLLMERVNP